MTGTIAHPTLNRLQNELHTDYKWVYVDIMINLINVTENFQTVKCQSSRQAMLCVTDVSAPNIIGIIYHILMT